jgi:DNA polymerase I-like protein with 3'-5' exonuclease and polymerase domains
MRKIYFVSNNKELNESLSKDFYLITVDEAKDIISSWRILQYDCETLGLNPHLGKLLMMQFGDVDSDTQVVVDSTTVSPKEFKTILESKYIIGHNLKFDLQWLFNEEIIPRKIYDTMLVEQLLYLGYPNAPSKEQKKYNIPIIRHNLKDVALRRTGKVIDKSIRGQIMWKGIDSDVILYGADDVRLLYDIMQKQLAECKNKDCIIAAKLECDACPSIAYSEWCGIKLDEKKWGDKLLQDTILQRNSLNKLNELVLQTDSLSRYVEKEIQGNLFTGFDPTPQIKINWNSPEQVATVFKLLGFDTTVLGEDDEEKDTVLMKHLKSQKGINDAFLDAYIQYKESSKASSSFGEKWLDSINPATGRLHTEYRQLGTVTGRIACGSKESNREVALAKKLKPSKTTYPNIQQLPADRVTRACFVAEEGNKFISCDYSAEESRILAYMSNDEALLYEFTHGGKDTHNLYAWFVFNKQCVELGCQGPQDVKHKAIHWRDKVKAVEFGTSYGAGAPTVAKQIGCSVEEAQGYIDKINDSFGGITAFAKEGAKQAKKLGYILINKETGARLNWPDFEDWKSINDTFTSRFWEEYKLHHKGKRGDPVVALVSKNFRRGSSWERYARNAPIQGTAAQILKKALTSLFNWIVDNNYFNKIKIVALVHDEICCEYPEGITNFPQILVTIMTNASKMFMENFPIPAEANVGDYWIH